MIMLAVFLTIVSFEASSTNSSSYVYCYNYGVGSATEVYVEAVITTDGSYGYGRAIITGFKAPFKAEFKFYVDFKLDYAGSVIVYTSTSVEFSKEKPPGTHTSVASEGIGYYPVDTVDSSSGVGALKYGICYY